MSQAVISQSNVDSLTGLVIPLADRHLLLPNVVVAELIPYRAPVRREGSPGWLLGEVSWRDLRLPLLSFEAAAGGQGAVGDTPRIAVLNALGGRAEVKFLALLVQGIPRSQRIGAELPRAEVAPGPLELAVVRIDDALLRIPDLPALEQLLVEAGY